MIDDNGTTETGSRRSRFSFLRPQFCLKVSIGFFSVMLCGGMLFSEHSDLLVIPGISMIMFLIVGIWGSIIGLVRWSRQDRSARWCTIILLAVVLLWVLLLLSLYI